MTADYLRPVPAPEAAAAPAPRPADELLVVLPALNEQDSVARVVHEGRRDEVVARIGEQLGEGRQVYWVCPLIEESEAVDLVNATATHAASR